MDTQLTILAESLERKKQVLLRIQEYNKRQEQCFMSGQVDLDGFDEAVEEKGRLIEQLTRLDEGFEIMYAKLAEELKDNRAKYAQEIQALQQQISEVMELSVSIQVQEKRNKQLIEQFFAKERAGIGRSRKASKAAYDYYKKMSNSEFVPPQIYDRKK